MTVKSLGACTKYKIAVSRSFVPIPSAQSHFSLNAVRPTYSSNLSHGTKGGLCLESDLPMASPG